MSSESNRCQMMQIVYGQPIIISYSIINQSEQAKAKDVSDYF